MALLRPLESGESYLGMLLCDIQVLELNLTEGANGVPTLPAGRQGIPVEGLPGPDCLHHHEESSQHLLQCKQSLLANLGTWP